MSVKLEHQYPFINQELLGLLNKTLACSWLKRDKTTFNSASVAVTEFGMYYSGLFESRTHLLDVTSEHAAIAIAISNKDSHITQIISVVEGAFLPNPLVIKVLADHVRRTGTALSYLVYDKQGKALFFLPDVLQTYYHPSIEILEKIKTWTPQSNCMPLDSTKSVEKQLHAYAIQGMETHFSSDSKTLYGAAVLANGKIFFAGVHSSFDKRLNLHAEMVATLSAFAQGCKKITHVCIVSTKFVTEVPQVCGCCRQFLAEIAEKNKTPIEITSYSQNGKEFRINLAEYLPYAFASGDSEAKY
ncbi:MAG: cytidine deaminase [Candidatus Woesearchaeota archaeon]|nr:cytidine deaminase [Candidatus Woesearchaeota archaeon]